MIHYIAAPRCSLIRYFGALPSVFVSSFAKRDIMYGSFSDARLMAIDDARWQRTTLSDAMTGGASLI